LNARSCGDEGELEVIDDSVHHGIVCEEGDDLHCGAALRAEERGNFIDFAANLGPAPGRETPAVLLEEYPLHLRDGEDDLVVRDIQKERLSPPLTPLLKPLGVAGWAKSAWFQI